MKKIISLLMIMLCLVGVIKLPVSAAQLPDDKFSIVNVVVEPTKDRMVRGYNYSYDLNYDGSKVATITGTVHFSIENGKARVSSADTPRITILDSSKQVELIKTSSTTSGNTAIYTIEVRAKSNWSIVWATRTCQVKCDGSGNITV